MISRENPALGFRQGLEQITRKSGPWFPTRSGANYLKNKKKNKALFSRAVTSVYDKRKFSHDAAHSFVLVIVLLNFFDPAS